ncbi:MAG: hypothetical protein ABI912_00880 [Actinomycetota bacterium]
MAALALAAFGAPVLTAAAEAAVVVPKAGIVGRPIMLQNNTQFSGYDVATDASGNFYVGWISGDTNANGTRKVRFCTLRPGAGSCAGGVQVIDSLGPSSAAGLRVLATAAGAVTLVWFHDTDPGSVLGPRGGAIATATSQAGGALSAATDVADAPSFGMLLDAQFGPGGALWTIAYKGVGTNAIEVRRGVSSAPETVATPVSVATTRLAFAGATPVIATYQYGQISAPILTARGVGASWSSFTAVPHTWSVAQLGLVAAKSGVRLVASVDNASYSPAASRFNGTGFPKPRLIGDPNPCAPTSHDLVSDASGRVADVGNECGKITVANLPDAANAALVRFSAGGTVAGGDPQIATTPRGRAVVAWGIESTAGNKLLIARVLLPARRTSVAKAIAQGTVTVVGPASCLPADGVGVAVSGRPAAGWKVASSTLLLGAKPAGAIVDGSRLTAGKAYALTGRVVFTRGKTSVTGTATLTFRSCSNP